MAFKAPKSSGRSILGGPGPKHSKLNIYGGDTTPSAPKKQGSASRGPAGKLPKANASGFPRIDSSVKGAKSPANPIHNQGGVRGKTKGL